MSREPKWMTALLDEGAALIEAEAKHGLASIVHRTTEVVRFEATPEGGSVPVEEPLKDPYYRYHCNCGTVGGRRSTEEAALRGHSIHVREMGEV